MDARRALTPPACRREHGSGSLARILHQAAQRATGNTLISHATNPFFEPGSGHKPRWPRPRRSFARVRVRAPSTVGVAMLSLASTRTRAKSSAIIAALGAICGLARQLGERCVLLEVGGDAGRQSVTQETAARPGRHLAGRAGVFDHYRGNLRHDSAVPTLVLETGPKTACRERFKVSPHDTAGDVDTLERAHRQG